MNAETPNQKGISQLKVGRGCQVLLLAILILGLGIRLSSLRFGTLYEPDSYAYLSIFNQVKGLSLPSISTTSHVPPAEFPGLYYISLIPHFLTNLPFQTIMLWSAPIFGMLTVLLTFIFTKQIFKDNRIALLAAFLLAVSVASLSKTLAGNFRGDSFIAVFLLTSLILLTAAFQAASKKRAFACFAGSCAMLLISLSIWTGATYCALVFALAIVAYLLFKIFKEKRFAAGIFILLIAFGSILGSTGYVQHFLGIGSQSASIQETQTPTLDSIFVSYGFFFFLSPALALLLWLSPALVVLGALLMLLPFRKGLFFNLGALVLIAYLCVTLFINAYFIRFVSLACVPVCILMAYFIIKVLDKMNVKMLTTMFLACLIVMSLFWAYEYVSTWSPVNGITPPYISSLGWLNTHALKNSYVLAYWSDGSEIEAIGNRSVYSDSVALLGDLQNTTGWFMGNSSSFAQFNPTPSYLLVRSEDFNESYGFCLFSSTPGYKNCTQAENLTYIQKLQPNWYRLWESCNALNCSIQYGDNNLTLMLNANGTKIYSVSIHPLKRVALSMAKGMATKTESEDKSILMYRRPNVRYIYLA